MSSTVSSPVMAPSPDAPAIPKMSVDDIIAAAKAADPALAEQLAGKALVGSKTAWAMVATPIVSWVATYLLAKYGIGISQENLTEIAGLVAAGLTGLVGIVMRWVTNSPITGILNKPPAG